MRRKAEWYMYKAKTWNDRIYIIKTKIISLLLYVTTCIHLSDQDIVTIQKLINNFLWQGKPARIKFNAAIADWVNGGISLPLIKSKLDAQKVFWFKRIIENNHDPWKDIFKLHYKLDIQSILKSTCSSAHFKTDKFYASVMDFWFKMRSWNINR